MEKTLNKNRVGFLDELRGLSIILMVVYHFVYDLVFIHNVDFPLFYSNAVNLLRDIFAGIFIVISGISCNYSKNNLKRGIKIFLFGMALTVITYFFIEDELIVFGILHMLGISIIIYGILSKMIKDKKHEIIYAVFFIVLFIITLNIENGYILNIELPFSLYEKSYLFPFGITNASFFSSDYFPLIPWAFLFFSASFVGVYIKNNRLPQFFYKTHFKGLAFCGRHTLFIYLSHQVLIYLILRIVFYFI